MAAGRGRSAPPGRAHRGHRGLRHAGWHSDRRTPGPDRGSFRSQQQRPNEWPEPAFGPKTVVAKGPAACQAFRPLLNARTNKLKGGGYEDCGPNSAYTNCKILFGDIDNIHVVRESYEKVHDMAYTITSTEKSAAQGWHAILDNSGYRTVLMRILSFTNEILKAIEQKGRNILIHCSDGWDRTA